MPFSPLQARHSFEAVTMVPVMVQHVRARRSPLSVTHAVASVCYHIAHGAMGTNKATLPKLLLLLDKLFIVLMVHEMHLQEAYQEAVWWEPFVILTCGVVGAQTWMFVDLIGPQDVLLAIYVAAFLRKFLKSTDRVVVAIIGAIAYSHGIAGVMHLCLAWLVGEHYGLNE